MFRISMSRRSHLTALFLMTILLSAPVVTLAQNRPRSPVYRPPANDNRPTRRPANDNIRRGGRPANDIRRTAPPLTSPRGTSRGPTAADARARVDARRAQQGVTRSGQTTTRIQPRKPGDPVNGRRYQVRVNGRLQTIIVPPMPAAQRAAIRNRLAQERAKFMALRLKRQKARELAALQRQKAANDNAAVLVVAGAGSGSLITIPSSPQIGGGGNQPRRAANDNKDSIFAPLHVRVVNNFAPGYSTRQLTSPTKFFRYHGEDNVTGKRVTWLTNKRYSNEDELRKGLAIRKDWGINITSVSEIDVPKGQRIIEGVASSKGDGYTGGDYQAAIESETVENAWIKRTYKAFD